MSARITSDAAGGGVEDAVSVEDAISVGEAISVRDACSRGRCGGCHHYLAWGKGMGGGVAGWMSDDAASAISPDARARVETDADTQRLIVVRHQDLRMWTNINL